ncbi:MAG: MaoC family dehydratase [Dehalococcoidia bacterium]|nr:MaoC family dehydratase [Dehalococcoidia bacterium]
MITRKTVDQYEAGEALEPYEFQVTPELNQRYLDAVEDHHPRYVEGDDGDGPMVHPGFLLNQSNSTKSPSHALPEGVADIHAKDEVEFLAPGRVGKTFRVNWKMLEKYVKRERHYWVIECVIVDDDGVAVLRKIATETFSRRR